MQERSDSNRGSQMHYSPNMVNTINNAIEQRKITYIEYDSREKGLTRREVEPMEVIYKSGKRNMIAYCRMRSDYRCFRLDRINIIKLAEDDYIPRPDFNISDYQDDEDFNNSNYSGSGNSFSKGN